MPDGAPAARGVYKPRRAQASPLFRLVSDHLHRLQTVYMIAIRTLTGERELAVGIVACLQTHGSRANWHPHLHRLVTDGGFRPDGSFPRPLSTAPTPRHPQGRSACAGAPLGRMVTRLPPRPPTSTADRTAREARPLGGGYAAARSAACHCGRWYSLVPVSYNAPDSSRSATRRSRDACDSRVWMYRSKNWNSVSVWKIARGRRASRILYAA